MPRKPRPLDRDLGVQRDAWLIVIASEDRYAPEVYLRTFRTHRVQFEYLGTEDGHSSPQAILERLKRFRDEYQLAETDQLWYFGDIDRWAAPSHIGNLTQVLRECVQADFHVALSNPCFELWWLLHFVDVLPSDAASTWSCADIEAQVRAHGEGYSKEHGVVARITIDRVRAAVARARVLDVEPDPIAARIPARPSTRVYNLIEVLLTRDVIVVDERRVQ